MDNTSVLREFMQKVWNEKDFGAIPAFVDPQYTIHTDTGDPWEGKTLDHREFQVRLHYSFDSFPDIHFAIQHTVADGDHVAEQPLRQVAIQRGIKPEFFRRLP
jgi:hypothetical protein